MWAFTYSGKLTNLKGVTWINLQKVWFQLPVRKWNKCMKKKKTVAFLLGYKPCTWEIICKSSKRKKKQWDFDCDGSVIFEKAKIIQQLRIKMIHSLKLGCVIFTCFWSGFFQILYQCLISLISPLDEPARVLCQDLLLVPKLIWQIDNLLLCFINMLLLYAKTFYANWFKTAGFNVKKSPACLCLHDKVYECVDR